MKILLVEDHPALADISCRLLRTVHGHDVQLARTGAEALAAAHSAVPDLVLLDLNLPDMTGYDIAKELRAEASFDRTVLVALTGFGDAGSGDQAREAGIDAYFRKPMDFEVLEQIKRA